MGEDSGEMFFLLITVSADSFHNTQELGRVELIQKYEYAQAPAGKYRRIFGDRDRVNRYNIIQVSSCTVAQPSVVI